MPPDSPEIVNFDGYSVDRVRWTAHWHGEPVVLSRKTFDLLLYLIDHRERVATKDDLLRDLWPKQVVEESNLNQQVFLLRKALSRHGSSRIIETVPGRGYRFVGTLTPLAVHASIAEARDAPLPVLPVLPVPDVRRRSKSAWVVVGCVTVIAAVAVAGLIRQLTRRPTAAPIDAVLVDLVGTGDAALDRALSDSLRIDIGQSPFLTVISRSRVKATLLAMKRAESAELTADVAQEVCERVSAQVVLQGTISKFGHRYLVSLHANSCVAAANGAADGPANESLAQAKDEVAQLDDLPQALNKLGVKIRSELGESRASIKRFERPLRAMNTRSLAALKAYSEGARLLLEGDELRDTLPERFRLLIAALYHDAVTGDIPKSIEAYKVLTALYPRSGGAFGNLSDEYDSIGQPALGLIPAEHALQLMPSNAIIYENVINAQLHSGQVAAARRTCERAVEHSLDGVTIRHLLLQALYAEGDDAGVQEQIDWGHAHADALLLHVDEILVALDRGEVRHAMILFAAFSKTAYAPDLAAKYQISLSLIARTLAEEGEVAMSRRVLDAHPDAWWDKNALVALAEVGEAPAADEALKRQLSDNVASTLWNEERAPEIRAAMSLAMHKPEDAVRGLAPAHAFDGLTFGPAFLEGEALLGSGNPQGAVGEFQKIAAHPFVDALSAEYPLSFLAAAHAYEAANDFNRAREQYERFLSLWRNADVDLPLLQAAQHDYQILTARLR